MPEKLNEQTAKSLFWNNRQYQHRPSAGLVIHGVVRDYSASLSSYRFPRVGIYVESREVGTGHIQPYTMATCE